VGSELTACQSAVLAAEVCPAAQTTGSTLATGIVKNTIFGVIARLAQVGTRLVTVPIVIAHLGLGGYGIWAIIMTVAAYMRFGSIGIKSAFQKYVAEATANGNYRRASQLLSTGSAAMLLISILGLIPISFFSMDLAKAVGVPSEFLKSAAGAISVLAIIMVLSNVGAAFEAIVMGGHRIDIARKFTTLFAVAEALGILVVLYLGFGLFAMALVMGLSEIGFVLCCWIASKKVVPQIHLRGSNVTSTVLRELARYACTYQLVNITEVVYAAIIPVALLRVFGDEAAGVYALAARLVISAQILSDAFLLPILSGGAKVYGSGNLTGMQKLIEKAFKINLGLALFPLSFVAVFGSSIVYAWTGQSPHSFEAALRVLCVSGFFYSFSLLGLVLYRTSGRALHDNIRQALRIVILLVISVFAARLSFVGILVGFAGAEMVGMVFMVFALTTPFPGFHIRPLALQALKLAFATTVTIAAGVILSYIPLQLSHNARVTAAVQVALAVAGCFVAAGPALWITRSISGDERRALGQLLVRRWFRPAIS